jgi:succinyl-CoA synthetase beta subunit
MPPCPARPGLLTITGFSMNIHEYQAKQLMEKFGVPVPAGAIADTTQEAERIARALGKNNLVVKAQIHAGGRGKGKFKSGFEGGVHLAKTANQVRNLAEEMLGHRLVTHQTGPAGRRVRKVLVAEAIETKRELYFAILIDRAISAPMIVASTEGGVDIETVAREQPDKVIREPIHPSMGLQPYQTRKLARQLGFGSTEMRAACRLFAAAYNLFIKSDCSMVEINPLVVTPGGDVFALDAKINFDDNALFRQTEIADMRDIEEEDPREVEATKYHLNYIGLDGNIGCMVNGAGLAMATMDIIKLCGGEPANFLDVGGGANEQQVAEAFKILMADTRVEAILVNIFGGIMKCDIIAHGIINAIHFLETTEQRLVPLVVRLEGTNVGEGRKIIEESGLRVQSANGLTEAARMVVEAAAKSNH